MLIQYLIPLAFTGVLSYKIISGGSLLPGETYDRICFVVKGRRAYKWGAGGLICGSLQYGVFALRANVFACESAMLKLKREVEMGRVKAAGEGEERASFAIVRSFPKEQ